MTLFGEPGVLPILVMIVAAVLSGLVLVRYALEHLRDFELPRGILALIMAAIGGAVVTLLLTNIQSRAPTSERTPAGQQADPEPASTPRDPKLGERFGEGEAAVKGDKLAGNEGGSRGDTAFLAHIPIYGGAEFKTAMRETLADFAASGSPELIENMRLVRGIRELTRDGGNTLAYVYSHDCTPQIFPRGWRTGKIARARTLAHESHHCWLYEQGRERESTQHVGFRDFERRIAREVYGSTGDSWWSASGDDGGQRGVWPVGGRTRRTPCPN
jgi:hypothetical protein